MLGSRTELQDVLRVSRLNDLQPGEVILVTDFDGTLAEVVSDPARAMLHPASLKALGRLVRTLGHIAVLSSRSTADLNERVPVPGVELVGDSGMGDMTSDERRRLDMFNVEAGRVLGGIPGVWLETKPAGSAIHYRHAQVASAEILQLISPAIRETGLHVQKGRRVIEVITRERPKGDALAGLIVRLQPRGIVCLGDDENDRPMFDYVGGLTRPHLTVGVASDEASADLFADCDLVVWGPDEVGVFLTAFADWSEGVAQ